MLCEICQQPNGQIEKGRDLHIDSNRFRLCIKCRSQVRSLERVVKVYGSIDNFLNHHNKLVNYIKTHSKDETRPQGKVLVKLVNGKRICGIDGCCEPAIGKRSPYCKNHRKLVTRENSRKYMQKFRLNNKKIV